VKGFLSLSESLCFLRNYRFIGTFSTTEIIHKDLRDNLHFSIVPAGSANLSPLGHKGLQLPRSGSEKVQDEAIVLGHQEEPADDADEGKVVTGNNEMGSGSEPSITPGEGGRMENQTESFLLSKKRSPQGTA
jgi:hypothetical protein